MREAFIKGFGATLGVLSGVIIIGIFCDILNSNFAEASKTNSGELQKTKEET